MKKLLLITQILLLQSFPSIGLPINKGLICEYSKGANNTIFLDQKYIFKENFKDGKLISISFKPSEIGFYFNKDTIKIEYLSHKNDEILIDKLTERFTTTVSTINWKHYNERYVFELNRKNLELNIFDKRINKTTIYKCEIFFIYNYEENMKEIKNKYQKQINDKMKDNKI